MKISIFYGNFVIEFQRNNKNSLKLSENYEDRKSYCENNDPVPTRQHFPPESTHELAALFLLAALFAGQETQNAYQFQNLNAFKSENTRSVYIYIYIQKTVP